MMYCSKKKRDLSNLVKRCKHLDANLKKRKNCKKLNWACSASPVQVFHLPITQLCANIGVYIPQTTKIGVLNLGASSNYAQKGIFIQKDLS